MKRFNDFINESLRDKMIGVSKDNLSTAIDNLFKKYPQWGDFNYKDWGFKLDNKRSNFRGEQLIFKAPDGINWRFFLQMNGSLGIEAIDKRLNIRYHGFPNNTNLEIFLKEMGYSKINKSI